MTTTANPLLENCCPSCNKCPDGGEILDVEILSADECSSGCGGCCGKKCNDNCGINIQSTNDCLEVDTSECGVVKITSHCPPIVTAGDNVTVEVEECKEENCSLNYIVSANCEDEKVKACSGDTTPGYLNQKIEGSKWINVDTVGCDGSTNSKLKLTFNEGLLPKYDYPEIEVVNDSKIIQTTYGGPNGHTIWISDKETTSYDNNVCIGFLTDKDIKVIFDSNLNAQTIERVNEHDNGRTVCTGNPAMATHQGVKILESGYYRVFGQLTVQNNLREYPTDADKYFINLGRAFLKLTRAGQSKPWLLATAKHGAYGRQILFTGGNGISISTDGEISFTGGSTSISVPEGGGTVSGSVRANAGGGVQSNTGFDGPWMTLNIDCYVDLYKDDVLTLGYRAQSNMFAANGQEGHFRFTGANDPSTEFGNRLFGGTSLGVQFIAPKLFQADMANKFFSPIKQ